MIRVAEWPHDGAAWDAFVGRSPDGRIMHLYGWKAVMERAYGHRTHYLGAWEGDELRGVLPLTLVRGLVVGRSLVSMPYMDYGGVCGPGHDKAERALVEAAVDLARRHRASLVLRYARRPELDLPCSLEKVTMYLQLGTSEEALWKSLPSERRNRIRKGQKLGLVASVHGPEGLPEFYAVFAENMRDLGSPVHSRRFFEEVMRHLPDHTKILLVRSDGQPIGAALMLLHGGMISSPWISSLRSAFEKCPNQVLYWEMMRFGLANGFPVLDFGRSSQDSGTFEAKRQWRPEPVQMYWFYSPVDARPPGEDVKRLSWAVGLWRRLPLPLANLAGPRLRRSIPN